MAVSCCRVPVLVGRAILAIICTRDHLYVDVMDPLNADGGRTRRSPCTGAIWGRPSGASLCGEMGRDVMGMAVSWWRVLGLVGLVLLGRDQSDAGFLSLG